MRAQLKISRMEGIPNEIVDEFIDGLPSNHFDVEVRTHGSVFAGMEWLMPTAIVLFIFRAYFDSIFSEMGKDHYKAFKSGLLALYRRASALRFTKAGSAGKISRDEHYSAAFSILINVSDDLTIKMLIQPTLDDADADHALSAFFDLVKSTSEETTSDEILERFGQARIIGKTLLVAYDFDRASLVAVDPTKR